MKNYQKQLDLIIEELQKEGRRPRLLLHGCCAPCSSYSLEYLSKYFDITLFFYNPNITPTEEYQKRCDEAKRLTKELETDFPIAFAEGDYDPQSFFEAARGLEDCEEGSTRCERCFELRLNTAASFAQKNGFEFVSTTLTISPLKNAELLNTVGEGSVEGKNVSWLPSDLKKRGGYLRSIELSKKHGLYRQNYCGCIFSKNQSLKKQ